jgi:hypothetical protein
MKKITLLFAFSIVSLVGSAQQSNEITNSISEDLEREIEYIIVLDDTEVDGNINKLLNDSELSEKILMDFHAHELAHDAPGSIDIESKFIEGAYSYNEYALNYTADDPVDLPLGA